MQVNTFFAGVICAVTAVATVAWAAQSEVYIREDKQSGYRVITSNGIPNHKTGQFPNSGNPHTLSAKQHIFKVTMNPKYTGRPTAIGKNDFGVALNGIPFDPNTAEYWNQNRDWNVAAAMTGANSLGMDHEHAHVQPDGTYHYHGIPVTLSKARTKDGHSALIGYAADGFPIYAEYGYKNAADAGSGVVKLSSSYRLKSGSRPSGSEGPGGRYDGTYVADYEYVADTGDLDACNGRMGATPDYPNGTYYYVLTEAFPMVPRCHMGVADASFQKGQSSGGRSGMQRGKQGGKQGGMGGHRHPPHGHPPPHGHHHPPRGQ